LAGIIQYLEEHMAACSFRSHFGIDCPGCGMQRAAISLLKGDIVESFHYNPGLLPVLFMFVFTVLQVIFHFKNGGKVLVWGYVLTVAVLFTNYILKLSGVIPGHP
jgi:hypothetical protein